MPSVKRSPLLADCDYPPDGWRFLMTRDHWQTGRVFLWSQASRQWVETTERAVSVRPDESGSAAFYRERGEVIGNRALMVPAE